MVRKINSYRAATPKAFQAPGVPERSRLRDKIGDFAPDIKIPETQQADFDERYARWRAMPGHGAGSVPEFIVWDYLVRNKHWTEGQEFAYQYNLIGGRTRYGGFVLDFFIYPPYNMAWNVQGLRYHLEKPRDRAKVILQDAEVASRGIRVVQLWEDDLLERASFVIEAALRGEGTRRHTDDVGLFR